VLSPSPLPVAHQPIDIDVADPLATQELAIVPSTMDPTKPVHPCRPQVLVPDTQPPNLRLPRRRPRVLVPETQASPIQARQGRVLVPDTQPGVESDPPAGISHSAPLSSTSSVIEISSAQPTVPQTQLYRGISTSSVSLGQIQPSRSTPVQTRSRQRQTIITPSQSTDRPPQSTTANVSGTGSARPQASTGNPSVRPCSPRHVQAGFGIMRPRNPQDVPSRRVSEVQAQASRLGTRLQSGGRCSTVERVKARLANAVQQILEDANATRAEPSQDRPSAPQAGPSSAPQASSSSVTRSGRTTRPGHVLVDDNEEAIVAEECVELGLEPVSFPIYLIYLINFDTYF
jgi:hypothetical protein